MIRSISGQFVALLCVVLMSAVPAAAGVEEPDGTGGGALQPPRDEMSDEERLRIRDMLDRNIAILESEGKLPSEPGVDANPLFEWPLRAEPNLPDYGFHGISNFVDQNPSFPGFLSDYDCGTRTYDTGNGYNHQGIDYFTWPFSWNKMDNFQVAVVAAAPGTIVGKDDGNSDRSCSSNNNQWNAVYVRHADLSEAWYGHLKNGSLTSKLVGETVETGEYLGIVGSSGNSTGPHLHLEVFDSTGALNEPYDGACNVMNPGNSWWASQRPYYDSAVNHVTTGFAPANHGTCPAPERPHDALDFNVFDTIILTAYYRDQLDTQTSTYTIYRPDGTVFSTWDHVSNAPHYAASWWYWGASMGGPTGIWRWEIQYEGQTYGRQFRLTNVAGSGRVPGQLDDPVPLTASWNGSQVTLDWDASCVSTDVDYEIYEGTIGTWYSHGSIACSTAGTTSSTFNPGGGSTYYLVVPTDTINEGSYGWDDLFAERPQGAPNCLSQQIGGNCPGCGDDVREDPEVCDGVDLNGETCASQGFASGPLDCASDCGSFDTSSCNPCGNDVCEPLLGENCVNCEADCNGVQNGNPGNQYCCGNGGGTNPIGCEDARCTSDGNTCVD